MHRPLLLLAAISLTTAACSPSPPPPLATPDPVPAPPTASPPLSSAPPSPPDPPAAAIAAADPPPYPEKWIDEAHSENHALSCHELIYKRGCAERRTGHVVVEVSLAPDGKVTSVKELENQINRDPQVVSKCVAKKVPRWKFHPPENVTPTFQMKLRFGDKC